MQVCGGRSNTLPHVPSCSRSLPQVDPMINIGRALRDLEKSTWIFHEDCTTTTYYHNNGSFNTQSS